MGLECHKDLKDKTCGGPGGGPRSEAAPLTAGAQELAMEGGQETPASAISVDAFK